MDKIKDVYEKNSTVINVILGFIVAYMVISYLFPMEGMGEGEEVSIDAQAEPIEEIKEQVKPIEEADLALVPEGQQTGGEIQPSDLLPMTQDVVDFTQQFPKGDERVKDKNFLIAGYNIGINTVASSLKNANLQLRSDPYIPRQDTGPWNQSTIMSSDLTNRKPLEIGTTV